MFRDNDSAKSPMKSNAPTQVESPKAAEVKLAVEDTPVKQEVEAALPAEEEKAGEKAEEKSAAPEEEAEDSDSESAEDGVDF